LVVLIHWAGSSPALHTVMPTENAEIRSSPTIVLPKLHMFINDITTISGPVVPADTIVSGVLFDSARGKEDSEVRCPKALGETMIAASMQIRINPPR
jgi:hypothetical protein